MANLQKVSMALDPTIVADLGYLCARMGISRSALVNNLLSEALPVMRSLLEQVPLSPTPADVVRSRGESAKIVATRIADLQGIAHDLFSE